MAFKLSAKPQTIKIYNLRADTNEFIGAGDAYIPPHTGLPALCTDIQPPEPKAGMVAIFNGKSWSLIEDHRGKTVYDKGTGEQLFITQPGALPPDTTAIASTGEHVKWDGSTWVKDEEAELAAAVEFARTEKTRLLNRSSLIIQTLADAVEMDLATDAEVTLLAEWKKYRVLLNRVVPDNAPDVIWPAEPDDVA